MNTTNVKKSSRRESNSRPSHYKCDALTTVLHERQHIHETTCPYIRIESTNTISGDQRHYSVRINLIGFGFCSNTRTHACPNRFFFRIVEIMSMHALGFSSNTANRISDARRLPRVISYNNALPSHGVILLLFYLLL